jgi:hypothetical protein
MPKKDVVREEKSYTILGDANDMVSQLAAKYPKILWAVNPEQIVVLGVTNKERPKTMLKLAQVRRLTPQIRTLIHHLSGKYKYIVEVYCGDWVAWSNPRRQCIMLHELAHIPNPNDTGLVKHDTEDFTFILDAFGLDWASRDSLPDLLADKPYPFNEELATRRFLKGDEEPGEGVEEGEEPESFSAVVPARHRTLWERIRGAWMVMIGKAESFEVL